VICVQQQRHLEAFIAVRESAWDRHLGPSVAKATKTEIALTCAVAPDLAPKRQRHKATAPACTADDELLRKDICAVIDLLECEGWEKMCEHARGHTRLAPNIGCPPHSAPPPFYTNSASAVPPPSLPPPLQRPWSYDLRNEATAYYASSHASTTQYFDFLYSETAKDRPPLPPCSTAPQKAPPVSGWRPHIPTQPPTPHLLGRECRDALAQPQGSNAIWLALLHRLLSAKYNLPPH
jgi:hypothetical protein